MACCNIAAVNIAAEMYEKLYFFVTFVVEKNSKMRALFFIITLLIVSCGKQPQPNQELLSAYEFIKKGDFKTAKTLAENSPCLTAADSAMYCIVRWAKVAADMEWYDDSTGIEKCIILFDGDDEKLAWTHLLKGTYLYLNNYIELAIIETRTAEKLAENINCDELKFLIYNQLASLNIDSYNSDFYDEVIEKLKKYAVTDYNKAEYYCWKCFGYQLDKLSLDSAKYYGKKALDFAENATEKTWNMFSYYYHYALIICDEDNYAAEEYLKKAMAIDSLQRGFMLLGKIYLMRGDLNTANEYFTKASESNRGLDFEGNVNQWKHEFYAQKRDFEIAYHYALQYIDNQRSVIRNLEKGDIKPIQVKFEGEIENLKLKSAFEKKFFMIILIAAILSAALISALFYQKSKLAERQRKISEAQQTINSYNQKISELTNKNQNAEEIDFLRQKVKALELKFSEIYVSGKNLYAHVLADNKIGRWSKDDYRNFIDYYQSLEFLYVRSFETDFVSLTDRQKIFLILCHIGKSKEQIMHIMTLEESSFRSMKSRIEGQKNKVA